MGKKYFRTIKAARRFAKTKNRKAMATSDVWRKKNKTRSWKNYVVKY